MLLTRGYILLKQYGAMASSFSYFARVLALVCCKLAIMCHAVLARHVSTQLLSASRFLGHGRRELQALSMEKASLATAQPLLLAKVCAQSRAFSLARFALTLGISESSARSPPLLAARRVSVRAIRREPISQAQRNAELEEEAKKIDLAPHKLLQKGDPDSMQAIIKDVNPVGYFLTLPNGREGYLPALDLGFTGGIVILERLFKVGQELTVRIVRRGGGGREILSMKKPEFAPNTDPKFIFSERLKQMNQGKS